MRSKLLEILDRVKVECKKAESSYQLAKKSSLEISASAAASPSQSGDRFHSQGAADLAKQKLENINKLKNEIETAISNEVPHFIEPPCYVKTNSLEFYIVENTSLINGFNIVSAKAPIGGKILNKQVGDIVDNIEIIDIG